MWHHSLSAGAPLTPLFTHDLNKILLDSEKEINLGDGIAQLQSPQTRMLYGKIMSSGHRGWELCKNRAA